MVVSVFSINHRTASLAEREPFQLQRRELGGATLSFKRISNVEELAIVATCNRVEFYRAHRSKGDIGEEVVAFYAERGIENPGRVLQLGTVHVGAGASRHLLRVASGMDSLVLGEEQIRPQIKAAYSAACGVGGPGKVLHKLFHVAFRISKQVRSETALGEGIRSVPGAAVEMLVNESTPKRAVVVGADETTEVLLNHLTRRSIPTTLVNRTLYTAEKLASAYNTDVAPWEELAQVLSDADLLFSATGAQGMVITPELIGSSRSDHPLKIADLAVPRDVDPKVGAIPGVDLTDLQDLRYHIERTSDRRCEQLPEAQGIVEKGVEGFLRWLEAQRFAGGIDEVRRELHAAADEELERFRGSFHDSEVKALDAFAHSLIKRFLKTATHHFEPEGIVSNNRPRHDPAAQEEDQSSKIDPETGRQLSCRELRERKDDDS